MSQIKIASAGDWTSLADRHAVEVKISQRGFLPGDSYKIAKEIGDRFVHEVRKIEHTLDPVNHKYAHTISCGCTEMFGPNRNGDGWGKQALERDMGSYLKHAKCFRDHKNSKDDLFYGRPKIAFFDADRGYGRLLCEYFATSKAADERHAKIADREINELDRGESIKVSHGTKIPHDTCSICGNDAPTRSKYCSAKDEGGSCRLFGCKTGLLKISEEGEIQFVHNDAGNVFYDISSIGLSGRDSARQADRIAYASPYEIGSSKLASCQDFVPGSSWLAEQMQLPPRYDLFIADDLTPFQARMAKAATVLAEYPHVGTDLYDEYDSDVSTLRGLVSASDSTKRAAVADLVSRGEMIGPRVFAKLCGASAELADQVAVAVPDIYRRICVADQLSNFVKSSAYTNAESVNALARGCVSAPFASVNLASISHRRKVASFSNVSPRPSYVSPQAAEIASEYAALKVAVAAQILASGQQDLGFLT